MNKIKSAAEIKKVAAGLRRKGKKIVFTNGCFDILHYGHIKYLERCKKLGDILIIGLNSDSSVRKIKGKRRPVTGEKERAAILASLEFVDYITIFSETTPAKLITRVTPCILAKGGDWGKSEIVGSAYVKKKGGKVVTIPFIKGYSTTRILKRIGKR
ncbi:MAG: D-glycero-beta-D-manno-heptose 1-phosphate adenylyltransferase [Candidatus Omnitrophota bacterium]